MTTQTFTLPKPAAGDSAAARQVAGALRLCADEVVTAQRQAHRVLADAHLHWTGTSARAAAHPLAELDGRTHQVSQGLRDAADRLDEYARVLDKAHHQHHWSLGKILTVAAVVVVTTTAVVITVGAAAPAAAAADAAVVSAEVAATTTAVGMASSAAVEAAQAVSVAVRALRLLRPVATFLRPQMAVTAGLTDYEAFQQVRTTGHLDVGLLGGHAARDLAVGALAGQLVGGAFPLLAWLSPRLAEVLGTRLAPRGFENLQAVQRFGGLLHAGLAKAGYGQARAAIQGSAVTGVKYTNGMAFDLGRLSDFDVAIGGEELMTAARKAGIKLRGGGTRSGPLTADELTALGLTQLQAELSREAGRKVMFMVYEDIAVARARSPYMDLAP